MTECARVEYNPNPDAAPIIVISHPKLHRRSNDSELELDLRSRDVDVARIRNLLRGWVTAPR